MALIKAVNLLRSLYHDRSHILLIFPALFTTLASCIRIHFSTQTLGEVWIDVSGTRRMERLSSCLANTKIAEYVHLNVKQNPVKSFLQILSLVASRHKTIRIFCRSGDHALWIILMTIIGRRVVLDIYDTRLASGFGFRKFLESMSAKLCDQVQCRDLTVKVSAHLAQIIKSKVIFLPDPPLNFGPRLKNNASKKVLCIGWLSNQPESCFVEVLKILLSAGFQISVYPGLSQRWSDDNLLQYRLLAKSNPSLILENWVDTELLKTVIGDFDFGLIATDADLNWVKFKTRDYFSMVGSTRMADFIEAGLVVISSRRKRLHNFLGRRYARGLIYIDELTGDFDPTLRNTNAKGGAYSRILELKVNSLVKT